MAVCPALRLLVVSCHDTNRLNVFALPEGGGFTGPRLVLTLRGSPLRFVFNDKVGWSGQCAFTDPGTGGILLILTDAGNDAVHMFNATSFHCEGHMAPPGSISGPRGVAVRGRQAAVSCWKTRMLGDHSVRLFEVHASTWVPLRSVGGGFGELDGQLRAPRGVRFTSDGSGVVVADSANGRISLFRAADGAFVRQLATGLRCPMDVEAYGGGWLAACEGSHSVEFVGDVDGERASLGKYGLGGGEFRTPAALAWIPDMGLAVQEYGNGRVQVLAPWDMVCMAAMSAARVAWMGAAARARPRSKAHPLWR